MAATQQDSAVEDSVRSFYDEYGWVEAADGKSGEDVTYREFRPAYRAYSAASTARTTGLFPDGAESLLIAGCGDMPDSHVQVADRFRAVTCIDISKVAIAVATRRLARPIDARVCSIVDMPLPDDSFDAVFCSHVLYHIAADAQARAVRQMIRVTKPGGRVVILYFNPASPLRAAAAVLSRAAGLAAKLRPRQPAGAPAAPDLYFAPHPMHWWQEFGDTCHVSLLPWEAMSSKVERRLIWTNGLARLFYRGATLLESRAPGLATRLWMFPIVVLEKKAV